MKPAIHISDQLIKVDTSDYLLTVTFKQKDKPAPGEPASEYPDEINVMRTGDTTNSLHEQKKRNCEVCGREFFNSRKDKKCCSKVCAAKKWRRDHGAIIRPVKIPQPIKTVLKNCIHCGKQFEPKRKTSKFCNEQCSKNHWYQINRAVHPAKTIKELKHARPKKSEIKMPNVKAALRDKHELKLERDRKRALKLSPNTEEMLPVFIDQKTTIYIKPGEDPEQARRKWIEKHNAFEKNEQ